MGEEVSKLSTNRLLQNSHGDIKYSTGNGIAKELIHMTSGHEPCCGDCLREWRVLGGGGLREGNQTTNSIIKIFFNLQLSK